MTRRFHKRISLFQQKARPTKKHFIVLARFLLATSLLFILSACGSSNQIPQNMVRITPTTSASQKQTPSPVSTTNITTNTNTEEIAATTTAISETVDTGKQPTTTQPNKTPTAKPDNNPTPTQKATEQALDETAEITSTNAVTMTMDEIIATTRHFTGSEEAAVTIIEFSDFQCPYCSRFSKETLPQIVETYIAKGQVRFGYRHAAFHEGDAFLAAEASECAADQDAFWPYYDLLIDRLAVDGKSDFTQDVLKQYATDLDLDTKVFNTCLESGKYADLVRQETQESTTKFKVSGTPAFLINGKRLVGAYPYEEFEKAIEQALTTKTDASQQIIAVEEEQPDPTEQAQQLMSTLLEQTRHFKGDPEAPITMIEFSDFQCPYCSKFAAETAPKIDEQYIQKGLVRLGYIHAAYHQEDAFLAAEASECAADQDAFWTYHDLLIDRLANQGKNDFPADILKQYAADLKLDTQKFNTCLDDGTYADLVREQTKMSSYIGVTGTPTFVINGKGLVGAQPFEVFQQVLDEELGKK